MSFGLWVLVIGGFCLSVVAGAGLFQALFVMPEYFSDPPASLRRYQRDRSWLFWLPLHAVSLLCLVSATVLFWDTGRRTAVLVAFGCWILTWVVTAIFFIPGVIRFNKVDVNGPRSAALADEGRRWMRRSSGRHVLTVAAALSMLVALAG
jgi:hypothetical protein